jgi:beta-1,4-N-acetylglucosaminyltransferase
MDPSQAVDLSSLLSKEANDSKELEEVYLCLEACSSIVWGKPEKMEKVCLVTTGATAPFPELVQAALQPESLQRLSANGFTKLIFQCGQTFTSFNNLLPTDHKGLDIEAFDFKADGLNREMRLCQAREGIANNGLVICHAGRFPKP